MVGRHQSVVPDLNFLCMSKHRMGPRRCVCFARQEFQSRLKGDLSEGQNYFLVLKQVPLAFQEPRTLLEFPGCRSIAGWGTACGAGYVHARELHSIKTVLASRLVAKSTAKQFLVEPLTTGVAGEHSACAICPVRAWGKANDPKPGRRVSKSSNRFAPVGLVSIAAPLCFGDA